MLHGVEQKFVEHHHQGGGDADNGRGLPESFDAGRGGRLGLQIVRALATGELRGTTELRNRVEGGTEAMLVVPLGRR